jgi:hypothetical protein
MSGNVIFVLMCPRHKPLDYINFSKLRDSKCAIYDCHLHMTDMNTQQPGCFRRYTDWARGCTIEEHGLHSIQGPRNVPPPHSAQRGGSGFVQSPIKCVKVKVKLSLCLTN